MSSGKAAIASFVMRGTEYLAAVRTDGDLLVRAAAALSLAVLAPLPAQSCPRGRVISMAPSPLRLPGPARWSGKSR